MRKYLFLTISIISACLLVAPKSLSAQTEIILDPASLTPDDEGYYYSGVEVDEDGDGTPEFHNKCEDYYEDQDASDGYDPSLNHKETGEQQGFKYFNCMIMPTCDSKSTPIDPPVATGYIQMHACLYSQTDSAVYSYIQSPAISNLQSIYMETSSDVSINDSRQIPYNIEYSIDGGDTWELTYYQDLVADQGGYRVTYDGSINLEIQEMIDASEEGPIVVRIITNDRGVEGALQGQFVKLHSLKLVAEEATSAITGNEVNTLNIISQSNLIISENTEIEVYSLMGQLIGAGNTVQVPSEGIYLVKTPNGIAQKVLVR